jgi:hypothetical protein
MAESIQDANFYHKVTIILRSIALLNVTETGNV